MGYLELLINFLWISCFAVVWPVGCIFSLMNQILELRFDTLKLVAGRRRPFPRDRVMTKIWVPEFARKVVHISIVMNILILLLPYGQAAQSCGGNPFGGGCGLATSAAAVSSWAAMQAYWTCLSKLLRFCMWKEPTARTSLDDWTLDEPSRTTILPSVDTST